MRIKKRGDKFVVDYYENGKRYRPHFSTKIEAISFASKLGSSPMMIGISLEKALIEFRDFKSLEITDPDNFRAYRYVLNYLLCGFEAIGVRGLSQINGPSIDRLRFYFKTEKKHSNTTINKRISTLRSFLARAKKLKYIAEDFSDFTTPLREDGIKRVPMTDEQADVLFSRIREDMKRPLMFIRLFGCRPKEMFSLRIRDVSFLNQSVTLRSKKGRQDTERILPLVCGIDAILSDAIGSRKNLDDYVFLGRTGKKIPSVRFSDAVRSARRRAALPEYLIPYGFRHKLISDLSEADVGMQKIQSIAGHRRLETTQRYIHGKVAALAEPLTLMYRGRLTS